MNFQKMKIHLKENKAAKENALVTLANTLTPPSERDEHLF